MGFPKVYPDFLLGVTVIFYCPYLRYLLKNLSSDLFQEESMIVIPLIYGYFPVLN